jgi:hypothetical protein
LLRFSARGIKFGEAADVGQKTIDLINTGKSWSPCFPGHRDGEGAIVRKSDESRRY